MSYQQLVQPNLSVSGQPDYCLLYVEQVFGVSGDPDPDAWQAWLDTKYKHTDPVPTNVSVPVWFSWTGTIDGVTQNWGHVAVSTPNGVYTNPLSDSGHKVFGSVQALAAAYGVQYVGWSEDLQKRIVQEENEMSTVGIVELQDLFQVFFGYQPSASDVTAWEGQETNTVIRALQASPQHAAYQQYLSDLQKSASTPSPVDRAAVMAYLNENLK